MSTENTQRSNILFTGNKSKDNHFKAQMERVYLSFHKQPKTMLMVSVETGILRANICRYVAKWQKQKCIEVARKGICPISKHRAGFYATNPELFKSIVELSNTKL